MSSNAWALQKAIYAKLTADVPLTALITGVHDAPNGSDELPYVVIGDDTTTADGTKTRQHYQHTLTLHIFAAARTAQGGNRGRKDLKKIMAAVEQATDRQPLTLDSGTVSEFRWEFSESFTEENGDLYHGVMRCRAFTNK